MYDQLIFIHSFMRWFVVGAMGWMLLKSVDGAFTGRPWASSDGYFLWALTQVFGYQLLFGAVLWIGASPLTKHFFAKPSLVSENPVFFFFFLRHPLSMLGAFAIFWFGKPRVMRIPPNRRYRAMMVLLLVSFSLIFSAVPWPWTSVGRPWFRLP